MNIVQMQIKDIIPYERNAKKHDDKQIKNVMESIKQFGITQPLVVDDVIINRWENFTGQKAIKL